MCGPLAAGSAAACPDRFRPTTAIGTAVRVPVPGRCSATCKPRSRNRNFRLRGSPRFEPRCRPMRRRTRSWIRKWSSTAPLARSSG